ncbi:MAG: 3-dehydroquinate synthase [Firmicutes bacterium]|nr:3-dehydroquinate synthase [Bacillota bacterium]
MDRYDIAKELKTAVPSTKTTVDSGFGKVALELSRAKEGGGSAVPIFLVTDENVFELYKNKLNFDCPKFVMKAGEKGKTLGTAEAIATAMIKAGCDRKTRLVALGGGVVGDTAGFAAASYMRGVEWVSIPTTLLSQVDSGVGGKTAVNIGSYKNMFGAFWMPQEVIVCTDFLATLPDREWLSGIGEVIKTAILEPELWEIIYKNRALLMSKDLRLITQAVKLCVDFKDKVTQVDFKETGLRRILNLGHTIGHALESADGYKRTHGEYVLWGIKYEASLFEDVIDPQFLGQIRELLDIALKGRTDPYLKLDKQVVGAAAMKDKKNEGGKVVYVVPVKAGFAEIKSV